MGNVAGILERKAKKTNKVYRLASVTLRSHFGCLCETIIAGAVAERDIRYMIQKLRLSILQRLIGF